MNKMELVIPNIYRVNNMIVNQYMIINKDEIILIDSGFKGFTSKLFHSLKSLDLDIKKINRILITHADADHYGAVNQIKSKAPVIVCASKVESEAMAKGESSRKLTPKGLEKVFYSMAIPLFHGEPVDVKIILKPGEILPIMDGLEVLDTKGHTPGHISFFFRKSSVLFAGDSITMVNKRLSPSIGGNTWDLNLAQKAFDYQMSLNPKYICAGHVYFKTSKD